MRAVVGARAELVELMSGEVMCVKEGFLRLGCGGVFRSREGCSLP